MSTPTPDWEALRQSVRGFVGSKVTSAQHADEITQQTILRLLERAARGEEFHSAEGAAIAESKYAAHEYWSRMTADRRHQQQARAMLKPRRGKRVGSRSTDESGEGHAESVRFPNTPRGQGRPRKSSPRRRMPALILYPDGATAVLKQRQEQVRYQSKPTTGTPSSLLFIVAHYEGLPPAPWEVSRELRLLGQALDRDRWREAERAVRSPRRGKR